MCGICGKVNFNSQGIQDSFLSRFVALLDRQVLSQDAFRVVDTRIEDDSEGSVSARMLSKMVGRKSELRTLSDARWTGGIC